MPVSAFPRKHEFYVYQFKVGAYPFYVGIGRDKRGTDRIRYVKSLLKPHNRLKLQQSSLQVRVLAKLLRRKETVRYLQTRKPLTRSQALAQERAVIGRLVRKGYLLANWQHNPHRHLDAAKAVRAILDDQRTR